MPPNAKRFLSLIGLLKSLRSGSINHELAVPLTIVKGVNGKAPAFGVFRGRFG